MQQAISSLLIATARLPCLYDNVGGACWRQALHESGNDKDNMRWRSIVTKTQESSWGTYNFALGLSIASAISNAHVEGAENAH